MDEEGECGRAGPGGGGGGTTASEVRHGGWWGKGDVEALDGGR